MGEFTGKACWSPAARWASARGSWRGSRARAPRSPSRTSNRAAAEALAAAARPAAGGRAIATIGDVVVRRRTRQRMVAETVAAFGRLDVLVNNAGIQPIDWYYPRRGHCPRRSGTASWASTSRAVYLMSQLRHARDPRAQGGGAIVNMASVQGLQSMPGVPSYAASKGGVLSLTRNMALDYARDYIRVTAICPGTIDSEMVRTSAARGARVGDIEARSSGATAAFHPLGRIGTPEDIAQRGALPGVGARRASSPGSTSSWTAGLHGARVPGRSSARPPRCWSDEPA